MALPEAQQEPARPASRESRLVRQAREAAQRLGIPEGYGARHRLPLQPEARRLVAVGANPFGRPQQLEPRTAAAWSRLRAAADADGICLQLVSGFRSLRYQEEIIQRKLARGIAIEDILRVSAAPGYSEHHTGRALDLTTPGYPALEQEFERSPAFRWLRSHAAALGFRLSFGKRNRHRLAYEPWHWFYAGAQ